jgi:hypothetical protein
VAVDGQRVRIGVTAPSSVDVMREELIATVAERIPTPTLAWDSHERSPIRKKRSAAEGRDPVKQPRPLPNAKTLAELEEHVQCRLAGQVRDLRVLAADVGLILRGRARTYYAKQLAQQAVLEAAGPLGLANEIEVR